MSESTNRTRDTAFEDFYVRTSPRLWGYVYRVCGDAALADDVVQDAFIRYLNAAREDLPERIRRAFVYKIASRLLTDVFRKKKVLSLEGLGARENAADPAAPDNTLSPDLRRLFESLPPRDRSLLWLAYAEGYDHAEIADIVGLKRASIKVILFRLKRSFAAALKDLGYGPESMP